MSASNGFVHVSVQKNCRTFTLKTLSQQTPQQRSTVVAEGENFKVVDAELVWDVDAEPLRPNGL